LLPELNANEARVIGCLIEKSIVTPDQYPLTLNALTNACNQKSGRDPVMALTPGEVEHTLRTLGDKHLVSTSENFKGRVDKYTQRFCNTRYSRLQFDEAETAIVCLLLLRGPQTPGELRSRSGRLHSFEDNGAVVQALGRLAEREHQALVVKLPRTPGRKDSEYMHQFCGPVDVEAYAREAQSRPAAESGSPRVSTAELLARIEKLEAQMAALQATLSATTDAGHDNTGSSA
jgi:uncharacterized protein YceH (UPF0502 family)